MKNRFSFVGALVTLLLAVLWYKDIITEPLVAIGTGFLTLLLYIFGPDNKSNSNKTKIIQKHSGKGDNVAGNKTINK